MHMGQSKLLTQLQLQSNMWMDREVDPRTQRLIFRRSRPVTPRTEGQCLERLPPSGDMGLMVPRMQSVLQVEQQRVGAEALAILDVAPS